MVHIFLLATFQYLKANVMKNFLLLKMDRIIQIVQQYPVEMTSLHSIESI